MGAEMDVGPGATLQTYEHGSKKCRDRSVLHRMAGTTRDVPCEWIHIDGAITTGALVCLNMTVALDATGLKISAQPSSNVNQYSRNHGWQARVLGQVWEAVVALVAVVALMAVVALLSWVELVPWHWPQPGGQRGLHGKQ